VKTFAANVERGRRPLARFFPDEASFGGRALAMRSLFERPAVPVKAVGKIV
jgi:hypothetical protein